jgi:hypothetical protein
MLDIELAISPPSRLTIFVGGKPWTSNLSDKTGKPAHNPCKIELEMTARLPLGTRGPLHRFGKEPACRVRKRTRACFG